MTTAKRLQNNVIRRTLSVKAIKLIILSVDDFPGSVSPRKWLPPQLYYAGVLEVTGVRFDALFDVCFIQVNCCFLV